MAVRRDAIVAVLVGMDEYLRVPAGKPFYLYVTQTLNRSPEGRSATLARIPAPSRP